jgi:hypothetical protein
MEKDLPMKKKPEDQFIVSPAGVTHLPTEASFTPNLGIPTTGFWREGKLGTELAREYDPAEVKETMRHLWAAHLLKC